MSFAMKCAVCELVDSEFESGQESIVGEREFTLGVKLICCTACSNKFSNTIANLPEFEHWSNVTERLAIYRTNGPNFGDVADEVFDRYVDIVCECNLKCDKARKQLYQALLDLIKEN